MAFHLGSWNYFLFPFLLFPFHRCFLFLFLVYPGAQPRLLTFLFPFLFLFPFHRCCLSLSSITFFTSGTFSFALPFPPFLRIGKKFSTRFHCRSSSTNHHHIFMRHAESWSPI